MKTTIKLFISYIRVSTQKQGQSGLGLEAQQAAVSQHVNGHGRLLAEYREVESGKRHKNRPELLKAIAHAKRSKATLVVAKLDRLARNVAFTSALMESGVDFVCCDNPHANRLTIHILAAVAEDEARRISERTKAALAAYKARGGLLGAHHPAFKRMSREKARKAQRQGSDANREAARDAYKDLVSVMFEWRKWGLSLQGVADRLNGMGHSTRAGKPWSKVQVMRVLDRVPVAAT